MYDTILLVSKLIGTIKSQRKSIRPRRQTTICGIGIYPGSSASDSCFDLSLSTWKVLTLSIHGVPDLFRALHTQDCRKSRRVTGSTFNDTTRGHCRHDMDQSSINIVCAYSLRPLDFHSTATWQGRTLDTGGCLSRFYVALPLRHKSKSGPLNCTTFGRSNGHRPILPICTRVGSNYPVLGWDMETFVELCQITSTVRPCLKSLQQGGKIGEIKRVQTPIQRLLKCVWIRDCVFQWPE